MWDDLSPRARDVVVVVMTEFGRRVYESASRGTDHGRAEVMLVPGRVLAGGRTSAAR